MVMSKPLCIIPARGGSKRFPKKNMALLNGKPLVDYAIEVALASKIFSRVCVSSEDQEILDIAKSYNPDFAMPRPQRLARDKSRIPQVCKYVLDELLKLGEKYEEFAILLPTSPLRTTTDIVKSFKIFKGNGANCVMSVTPFSHPPQRALSVENGLVKPYFGNQFMKQAQELAQLYRHDGTVIFIKTEVFLANNDYYVENTLPYYVPLERAVDVDNLLDLKFAEFLMKITPK
ncbi:MAG: N-acylneuraminate cytidylyltransferase [Candidatus Curtissbacteria bacterium GW2011_GWA1_40_47]|nr:MAG: N-acylneuraminate cytidylyltransferase [Candidatus Curtissbacteria bacterium GW2011_GWB1_40_28]KKR62363.1 MAG: N-acylneuraminate cytidylyltransferase [Microgenomates group bacterium GW2011_GWC1_40_35]KKR66436.1 MAG: N-acylneuraminate cytidylyltransferase [Candidatus Curtissbacteria bacterium GW2011_GWA1_40_47]KKR77904.1 MAG: N-acylneuraminate cytidylyltransferase [Candidatus Curtissbacteria bacterium GW2011_GWD1_40_8]KKS02531.1 MAG: N-acylneuraminate cytidylyltransferase [Candidatus Cur